MKVGRGALLGIALVCFANLLLSILVTRLFSATMFYHFTFMAIGLAMFGIAASGIYVFLAPERLTADVPRTLARYAQLFAATTIVFVVFTTRFPVFARGQVPDWSLAVFAKLALMIVLATTPFFCSGVVVSLALTHFRDDVNRVYFWDLVGAALAALLAGVVLGVFGAPTGILVAAAVALIAASLFEPSGYQRSIIPALGIALVAFNMAVPLVRVGSVKWDRQVLFEKWNAFSRITVDQGKTIKIDAGAATHIEDLRTMTPGMQKTQFTALALSTWGAPPENVLIIGPGGGRDVMFSLAAGAKNVVGVEINPLIANDIMRGRYAEANGHLYTDPRVRIVVDEGRSFIRRTPLTFDMIQASLVDTYAATAAGAFALTENTLYTVEAFQDYYAHLTDRGVVTMTRFYGGKDGQGMAESQRLIVLAAGALERSGVAPAQARQHMVFATAGNEGTLIVKKTPFTADEVQRLETTATAAGFAIAMSPTSDGSTLIEQYVDRGAWSDLVLGMRDDIRPPTDDRPFFFFFTRFGDLFSVAGKKIYDPSLWVLLSLGTVLAFGILFTLLPLLVSLVRRRRAARVESPRTTAVVLSYFGLVGFGFMAIEIALLQRFTLFLGHPTYSLVVILFVILLSTALGSRLSQSIPVPRLRIAMLAVGLALGVLTMLYGVFLGDVLRALIAQQRALRIVITGLLVAPCGLLMGVMIPSAIRLLADAKSDLVPWGWGVNGAMSVIGTSIATMVAMYVGFTATFEVGAITYALAGLVGWAVGACYRRADSAAAA